MEAMKILLLPALLLFSLLGCVDKANLKPLKVVCLGDSITYGHRLADPRQQSYPSRLSAQARGQWEVLNCGRNGATVLQKGDIPITSQDVYKRALASQPDVLVLLLGTNDTKDNNWLYNDDFVTDYVALIQTLQEIPSKPRVIACLIPPILIDYPNGLTGKRVQEVNDLLKEAVAVSGVDLLDLHGPLLARPDYFTDGVHPNDRGALEIASLVFDRISSTDIH